MDTAVEEVAIAANKESKKTLEFIKKYVYNFRENCSLIDRLAS